MVIVVGNAAVKTSPFLTQLWKSEWYFFLTQKSTKEHAKSVKKEKQPFYTYVHINLYVEI